MKTDISQLPEVVRSLLLALREDNFSGSIELTLRAADVLLALLSSSEVLANSELSSKLECACIALVEAQPAMAPIVNLCNITLLDIDAARAVGDVRASVRETCRRFAARVQSSSSDISCQAVELIPDGATVLTFSRSLTVLTSLLHAREVGRSFQVICPESRPGGEGIRLAQELGEHGIVTNLVVDAAAFSMLSNAAVVIVGADAFSREGVVNKIGTKALAALSSTLSIPFCVLCGTEKFLPPGYPAFRRDVRNPKELVAGELANVVVTNEYFDLTPLNLVTNVVTERGVDDPAGLLGKLPPVPLHPRLARLVG